MANLADVRTRAVATWRTVMTERMNTAIAAKTPGIDAVNIANMIENGAEWLAKRDIGRFAGLNPTDISAITAQVRAGMGMDIYRAR